MNASSTVNRIAADFHHAQRRIVAAAAQEHAAGPERQRRNAVTPQQPVEDRCGADGATDDARLVADPQHHDGGKDRGQRTQERDRPLHRNPGGAERHQRQRNREPAFFQRERQGQREGCERAGRKQRDRGRQARPVLALAQDLGGRGIGCRQDHCDDRERNRTVEMRDAGIERDQQRQRREHRGGRPHHRNDRHAPSGPAPKIPLRQNQCRRSPPHISADATEPSVAAWTDAGSGPPGNTSMSGFAAHRPFGEHDEDQSRGGADRADGGIGAPGHEQIAGHQQARTPTIATSAWELFSTISVAPNR